MFDSKGFDSWADNYDKDMQIEAEKNSYPFAGYREVHESITDTILKKKGATVLELGFGTGTLASELYNNGCEIYGQDYSARMTELAQAKIPGAHLYQKDFGEGLAEQLLEKKYDFIVATYAMHHLTDEQKVDLIHDLLGLLKSGGSILIGDIAFETRDAMEACRQEFIDEWDDEEYYFAADEFAKEFPEMSFEKVSFCGGILTIPSGPNYQDINAETIDRWIEEGWEWGKPISHEEFEAVKNGDWDVKLTPTKYVPHSWFGDLKGKKILGLASGGGQQMPIFAALGAECTVMDYSTRQIESEKLVAEREGYEIRAIQGDMTKRFPFEDEEFDIILHPVSNCYVQDVRSIWKECYRVLKHGGYLIAGTDHYVNYLVDNDEKMIINHLPFDPLNNPEQMKQLQDDDAGVQFSHSLEEQIGGQLEAGFRLLELYEDTNGEGRLHELNIPTFLAMRSLKE